MAESGEIVEALEALAIHCRAPLMGVDDRSRWLRDWCEDLREFPISAVSAACKVWRAGDSAKFPTPGQLLPLVRAQCRQPKSPSDGDLNNRAWTWPTDDELDAMPLRERRRQYLIMASEAAAKAGPMNEAGEFPRPSWRGKARAYTDEARRIAEMISRGAQKHAAE